MATGILRIQAFAARQSAPVEGVTVNIVGDGFTAARMTDAEGNAADVTLTAPDCALSLEEDNTTRLPYAVCSLTASKAGYRTVRIQGIQVFAGQVTLAQPEMIPETEEDRDVENPPIVIPPHPLFAGGGGSGRAPTDPCAPRVLDRVIIPKNITVHLGKPAASARNVTVSFRRYIANVASSEVYPTWEPAALRANALAIISFALNRIYTEYYRSRGYPFDITSSTAIDQKFINGRNIYDNISELVDELFTDYLRKQGFVEPLAAKFCNGVTVTCQGLSQWGSQYLAQDGANSIDILRTYYGEDVELVTNAPVQNLQESYPGSPVRRGDIGVNVSFLQVALNRISQNYPAIPKVPVDAIFGEATENAVRSFQSIFSLTVDSIVGRATWYTIVKNYTAVLKLGELQSLGQTFYGYSWEYPEQILPGEQGAKVTHLQYMLSVISQFNSAVQEPPVNGVFGDTTTQAVTTFQRAYNLPAQLTVRPGTASILSLQALRQPFSETKRFSPSRARRWL